MNETIFGRDHNIRRENHIEKEPKIEKIVLLVRHPSVEWLNVILDKAEEEGKDIETYTPVDKKGLKMTRFLSRYLQTEYLQNYLTEAIGKKNIDKDYTIWSSPIKRALSEAKIISKNIKLAHIENPNIPIPKNNQPIIDEHFEEVPWIINKQEALSLIQEAKQKGIHPVKLWFEKYPDEIIDKLNKKLTDIKEGLNILENSETPIDIVFTHRLTGALMLWLIEQKGKKYEDLTITKEDLPRIMELCGRVAYTSISEIRKIKDQQGEYWKVQSVGETPHLDDDLKQGTF